MREDEIEPWIEDAFRDGYSIEEIHQALHEEGVEEQKIRTAVRSLRSKLEQQHSGRDTRQVQETATKEETQATETSEDNVINGVDLTGNSYTVKQKFFLNRYSIYDSSDSLVMKARQKMFRLKENFPFKDPDGDVVFRVKGNKIVDVAGDYAVVDEESGDPIASLKRNYTIFSHKWKVKSASSDERLIANIHSANKTVSVLRVIGGWIPYLPNIFGFIPHRYTIENPDGDQIGSIEGKLSIRDIYTINIEDASHAPKEALVASAIAMDALEGN